MNFLTKINRYLNLRFGEVFKICLKPLSTWVGKNPLPITQQGQRVNELPEESKAMKN